MRRPALPIMLKWLVFPILMLTARAADPFEQWDRRPAEAWRDAFALKAGAWGGRVFGGTRLERIVMFHRSPGFDSVSPQVGYLVMNWLDYERERGYRRSMDRSTGIATTSFVRNGARITESVFISKAESLVVVHLQADKPGALNFRVCLMSNHYQIKDRRELDSNGLRVWVLPFESDVSPDGEGLVVRGEGEALILLADGHRQQLDRRFQALGLKHDGREVSPDLTKLWSELLKMQKRAAD